MIERLCRQIELDLPGRVTVKDAMQVARALHNEGIRDVMELKHVEAEDVSWELMDATQMGVFASLLALARDGRVEGQSLDRCRDAASIARSCNERDRGKAEMRKTLTHLPEGLGRSLKPRHGLDALKSAMDNGLQADTFVKFARVEAIMESCPASWSSHAVGLRSWARFSDAVLKTNGKHLPPTVEGLVSWSMLFCVSGVYSNYLTAVRFGCQLSGLPFQHTYHPDVKRAVRAVKAREPPKKAHMYIQAKLLKQLVRSATGDGCGVEAAFYICLYSFMLRAHAEGIPLQAGSHDELAALPAGRHSAIAVRAEEVCLKLAKRKNKRGGSLLVRRCSCTCDPGLCPVHALGPFFADYDGGCAPFEHFGSKGALRALRERLTKMGIANAGDYGLHDFRRGHAQDMLEKGAGLNTILQAGEWRSTAFTAYLKAHDLEARAVLEADRARAAEWVRQFTAEDSE